MKTLASTAGSNPSMSGIAAAQRTLSGNSVLTPLVGSPLLDARLDARVLLKLECQQRTGSFKFRGAYNKVASLAPEVRARGVAATSSGNHAQALAAAGRMLNSPVTIGMPVDTPIYKLARTRRFGATIVHYDRYRDDEKAFGLALARDRLATLVHPFDDPEVIAGQATVGLEMFEQSAAIGADIDLVLVPCGGGGLTAGVALAAHYWRPAIKVCCVEPEGYDDTVRSMRSGERVANDMSAGRQTLCDALMVAQPGERTFHINRELVSDGYVVGDSHVRAALALLADEFKLIVEPAGAIGLAALLAGFKPPSARCVAVIISGGNLSVDALASLVATHESN